MLVAWSCVNLEGDVAVGQEGSFQLHHRTGLVPGHELHRGLQGLTRGAVGGGEGFGQGVKRSGGGTRDKTSVSECTPDRMTRVDEMQREYSGV